LFKIFQFLFKIFQFLFKIFHFLSSYFSKFFQFCSKFSSFFPKFPNFFCKIFKNFQVCERYYIIIYIFYISSDDKDIWTTVKKSTSQKEIIDPHGLTGDRFTFRIAPFKNDKIISKFSNSSEIVDLANEDNFPLLVGVIGGAVLFIIIIIFMIILLHKRYKRNKPIKVVKKEFIYSPKHYSLYGQNIQTIQRSNFGKR